MDLIPNEVLRMFFEHIGFKERWGIMRVCMIWGYLVKTFKYPRMYRFVKQFGDDDANYKLYTYLQWQQN